jgi:hypothetical protein
MESLTGTPSSEVLTERSEQRFAKTCAVIRKFFAKDPEVAEEAISLAKNMLSVARAEIIAKVAATPAEPIDFFVDLFKVDNAGGEVSVPDVTLSKYIEAGNETPDPFDHVVNFQRNELLKSDAGVGDFSWDPPLTKSAAPAPVEHDGGPLNKSQIQSGMQKQFGEVREACSAWEEEAIQKAIRALDVPLFFDLLEKVKSRLAAA